MLIVLIMSCQICYFMNKIVILCTIIYCINMNVTTFVTELDCVCFFVCSYRVYCLLC